MFEIDHFLCLKKQLFSIKELTVDVFWGNGGKDEKPLQESAFGYTENLLYFYFFNLASLFYAATKHSVYNNTKTLGMLSLTSRGLNT